MMLDLVFSILTIAAVVGDEGKEKRTTERERKKEKNEMMTE
jgi:hypothetical protein